MNLAEGKIGKQYIVKTIEAKQKERLHLLEMGLIPGSKIEIVKRAPLGDPIEIRLHGYSLAIRVSRAKKITILDIDSDKDKNQDLLEADNVIDFLYNLSSNHNCKNCKLKCRQNLNLNKRLEIDKNYKYSHGFYNPFKMTDKSLDEFQHPKICEADLFVKHNYKSNKKIKEKNINVALVGNQNSGKTTLFNQLTGSNQHVGNFPGVTIEKKEGLCRWNNNLNITDLPGIYSLTPYSNEEILSRDFTLSENTDCIINIVDATSIERSLYLTIQLIELNKPMVLALNMMDEVRENGGKIQINELEYRLGIPVVPISAVKGEGIEELIDHLTTTYKENLTPNFQEFCKQDKCSGAIHRGLNAIYHLIEDHTLNAKISPLYAATMLVIGDSAIENKLKLDKNEIDSIEHIVKQIEHETNLDRYACITVMKYRFILRICKGVVFKGEKSAARLRSEKIDKILTGKWTGIPIFVIILGLIFWLTFSVIGTPLQELLEDSISNIGAMCESAMTSANVNEIVVSFVSDGLFAGVGTVLSFIPIIIVLFFFLSILEDSGYMARIAFIMDKILRKIGLSGSSIVPMLLGFGCSVPAIIETRFLASERDRKLTILLVPFMSCSGKLPLYGFISVMFFPQCAGLVMTSLYFLGIFIGILVALILKGRGKPMPFIMELPNYRFPSAKNIAHMMYDKCGDFIKRAFSIIFIATLTVWFLQHITITFNFVEDEQQSLLANIARFIAPVFNPLGFGDWRCVVSLIAGFLAKESIVSSLSVLFDNTQAIASILTPLSAYAFMVFVLLYTPCVATIASINKELGFKYAIRIALFQCVIAYLISFIILNIGKIICMF